MKKLLALVFVAALACSLSSCLPDDGYTYSSQFSRIVTIDHSVSPIRFYCDYTNEIMELDNIKTDSDLGPFNLKNADRALIKIQLDAKATAAEYNLLEGSPIKSRSVSVQSLEGVAGIQPVFGFEQLQLERGWLYPYAWVSRGYLNIIPQILSDEDAEPYLVPQAVSRDTLKFNLKMKYELGEQNYRAQYACFDLRSLADTVQADSTVRPVMRQMIDRLHNEQDSVMVVVTADLQNIYPDTVITATVPTNYFFLHLN